MDSEFEKKAVSFDTLLPNQCSTPIGSLAQGWAATHFGGN